MKKAIHIITFAAVAIAALTSCAKEELNENAIPAGEPIEVSLNGLIGDFTPADATKATAESVVRVTWGSGDNVFVYDGSNASIGTLTVTPDNNNASYAMLSGTITASAASPSKLTLVYVKGATAAPDIAGGKISIDLSSQNQTEVPFVLYTTVAYDAAALTKTNEYISFTFATSVMTVNCTGLQTGDSGAVAGIDKAEIDGVSTRCELTIDGSGVTAVAGTTPGTITRTETAEPSVFTQSDSRGSFRLALAADPAAPAARNILVHQGSKVSGSPFTSATLSAGKSYNTVYQMGEYISTGALSGAFTVNAQGKKVYFSPGNLWFNGSAFKFEKNQYDYTPGSTSAPVDPTHISHFYWSKDASVAYAASYSDASANANDILFTNTTETTANPDFAVNGVAGKYRALSSAEWQYLLNYGTYNNDIRKDKYKVNVTVCGKRCVVLLPDNWDTNVISINKFAATTEYNEETTPKWSEMEAAGAVCLPAAGARLNNLVENVQSGGFSWSSSALSNTNAFVVNFSTKLFAYNSSGDEGSGLRSYASSIRLVTEASGGYVPAVKVTGVTLAKDETSILVGAKKTLVATVAPANATNKQVIWSSSKPSVATVDATSGEVTGAAPGSAVITAKTADGNFKAFCLVTVKTLPAGALNGVFTVADDGQGNVKTVYFLKGNLWYGKVGDAPTATFNFEANQYDYQSTWTDSHVSHFYWSMDASVAYAQSYSDANANVSDIFFTNDPTDSKKAKPDFTVNGITGKYRTLSEDEWYYLLNKDTSNDIRKDKCKYNVTVCGGKKCTVLLPDNWDTSVISLSNFKTTTKYDETTTPKWSEMEAAGAVCLPAAGGRVTSTFFNAEEKGQYSSTNRSTDVSQGAKARILVIESSGGAFSNLPVSNAFSIRLVTDVE